tara:strand:- start:2636 stop:3031 length:396 start_codon:yes stop_codon:yes gene_type:complete
MATSKIQTVVKTDNTWQGQSGTMYDYEVTMEDGSAGIASSTSPDSPPYGVGDEVEYTSTTNKYGTKLRVKKAGSFTPRGQDPAEQKRIENSWALKTAVAIMGECAEDVSYKDYLNQAVDLARVLIQTRDSI